MSDPDSKQKKAEVPSWQTEHKKEIPTDAIDKDTTDKATVGSTSEASHTQRATVIEHAKKFLNDDQVRNASTDEKIAFLEKKGLAGNEISDLLGVSRNAEASAPQTPMTEPTSKTTPRIPSMQTQSLAPRKDTPPIITYPEFLTTPTAPSPLVTKSRLLITLYTFAGLSALLYGTKNLLVAPMLAQLTESRLSLAETAASNLRRLILQLQSVVSEIPMTISQDKGDEESEDEDPSDLFHRDVGVQTSRPPSPSSYLNPLMDPKPASTAEEQALQLESMGNSLKGLLEDSGGTGQETSDLSMAVGTLREYLDELAYVVPTFGGGIGGFGGQARANDDDEIGRVKASIRGVKGVLLSAKSFPSATRAR